ncbi:MAG: bifunctional [glutamine synthetase] adenylyltransferase/[glutamine synthetase]-adenylyl-L-tyrosine phosphorylase [Spirochaetaceae bacterium]|nr:bifunctional [glutamine synthetase] adenylyltransferase/[glutamine synthetase]-adenylyl-L-tyrosine phosphorylase [Spirochaetaceae bacterium]
MIIADPASPSVLALASQADGFDTLRPHHRDQAEAGIDRLRDGAAREGRDALGAALETPAGQAFFSFLCGNSPHLSLLLQRDLELTQALVEEPPEAITGRVRGDLAAADPAMDRDQLMTFLRRQRNRVAVLAAAYDCFGIHGVMECAELLSDMADHAVRLTVSHLLLDRVERGDLERPDGDRWGYFALAMGKHGSRELNYSSDIDLIVLFDPESVRYTGSRTLSDCFVRVTQDLVRILQTRTAGGYVFRTDLRLRPDPSSTPVAITVDFALNYYRRFGRTWERTALIKARPVAGDLTAGAAYLERLSPFIWDEALDFTSVEEIRSVSQQIHDFHGHGAVRAAGHNVKLGRGGIREIEFFVHMHQLAHGGRNRRLRGSRLLAMLETLDGEHHIMPRETAALRDAYLFLRRVEHRLQMVNDAQTQVLPDSEEGLEHIASFMGLASAEELVRRIESVAGEVHDLYRTRFNVPESEQDISAVLLDGPDEHPDAVAKLEAAGFTRAPEAIAVFRGWTEGRHESTGSERARTIIREILHEIVDALGRTPDPDRALARLDRFLAALPEDLSFFSMLRANTWLLNLIAVVMGSAPRMADVLEGNPRLLQAVLDPSFFLPIPERDELARELDERLAGRRDAAERVEQVAGWAGDRRFQVAVQALENLVTVDEASAALCDVAGAVIDRLLADVLDGLHERHGPVPGGGCAVVARGRLGAGEMTFGSDLDLLFAADFEAGSTTSGPTPIDASAFYRDAASELTSLLRNPSTYGRLYELDERLRTSGQIELPVSTLDEFRDGHTGAASTSELMSLTRASVVCGDPATSAAVTAAIEGALASPRDPARLHEDVARRREAIAAGHPSQDPFDVQHVRGGLVDLESLAQYLRLRHAHESPEVLVGATASCFDALGAAGVIPEEEARFLAGAVRMQRTMQAMLRLTWSQGAPVRDAPEPMRLKLATALECAGLDELDAKLRETQAAAFDIYRRRIGLTP